MNYIKSKIKEFDEKVEKYSVSEDFVTGKHIQHIERGPVILPQDAIAFLRSALTGLVDTIKERFDDLAFESDTGRKVTLFIDWDEAKKILEADYKPLK